MQRYACNRTQFDKNTSISFLFGFGGQGNAVLSIDLQTQCASQGTSDRTSTTIDLNNSLERLEARRLGDTSLWTIDISSLFLILYLYSVRG